MDKSRVEFEKWFFEDLKVIADYDLSWQAWQASRKALVVELPSFFSDRYESEICFTEDIEQSLDAAGVAYK